jgi:dimethylargininase
VFVEDPLIVVDEIAIVTRMGTPSRRPEGESLEKTIAAWRPVRRMREPATLEGGDVMRVGRDLFVGISSRTNADGAKELARELTPFGYSIRPVEVRGCLHLKSACCSLGDGKILANREWFDVAALSGYEIVDVASDEPGAANILRIGGSVVMPECYPGTAELLCGRGLAIRAVDISELMKAEAAVTCSSVIFDTN